MVERAAVDAGLDIKAHAHMLCHACGYKLVNDGHDTRAIQAYLGHRNIRIRRAMRPWRRSCLRNSCRIELEGRLPTWRHYQRSFGSHASFSWSNSKVNIQKVGPWKLTRDLPNFNRPIFSNTNSIQDCYLR
jgi:Phage integrase family